MWKDVQHDVSLDNSKSKQHWGTTTHVLEWLKSQTLKTPKTDKNTEQQELSFIADGTEKW